MTYTLANIPDHLDRALRQRAVAERKSPEAVIIDLMASGLSVEAENSNCRYAATDESHSMADDVAFDVALREQRLIDWETWSDDVKRRDLSGIAGQHLITPEMNAVFGEQRRIDLDLWK